VALSFLGGTAAKADQLRIDSTMRDYRLSRSDAAEVATLSAALHFGERDVVSWARGVGRSVRDVGPAYVISSYSHEPVERIWSERRGRSWYDYGIDLGIDWGRFNRLDLSYSDFDRMLWLNLSSTAYGSDEPLWEDLSGQGLAFDDVILTIVLGDGNRDRCDYYAYQYRNHDRDWAHLWTSAGRDPHLWVGYRDNNWRSGDRQSSDDRSGQRQVDRNKQDQDRKARDKQVQDQQNRQRQDNRDSGSGRQNNGNDKSQGDNKGAKDRGGSGGRGR